MRPEVAYRRIEAFRKRFGEAHLYLAYHAAFPLALTPDLLYRVWANFQRDIHGEVLNIPWIAVADLLLSSLCDEVGHELYEMEKEVRNALLIELKANPRFGTPRINELSNFLLAYVRQQLDSPDIDTRDFAQAQRWTALAYTKPNQAARELALTLSKLKLEDKAEWVRVASLVETVAEPLADFEPLLIYSRRMADFVRSNQEGAAAQLRGLHGQQQKLEVAGVSLNLPETIENKQLFLQNTVLTDAEKYGLTSRETEIWLLRQEKYSYKEIADKLHITVNTVKRHLKNIYAKQRESLWTEETSSDVQLSTHSSFAPSSKVAHIICVDDVADNLLALQAILESAQYKVDVIDSGSLALAKIEASLPDLVLLDVRMPEMDGYEVTRRIRQNVQLPFIPILMLADRDNTSVVEALDMGANDCICKPIELEELLARVRSLLRLKHSIDERDQILRQFNRILQEQQILEIRDEDVVSTEEQITQARRTFRTEVLESPIPVLVHMGAAWSGLCRIIIPLLKEFQLRWGEQVKLVYVNADENLKLATTYRIKSLPTLILFENGKVVHQLDSFHGKDEVRIALEEIIESNRGRHSNSAESDRTIQSEDFNQRTLPKTENSQAS